VKPPPADVVAELARREAILHRPGPTLSRSDLARLIDPAFVEIGASARRWDREATLALLERRRDAPPSGSWRARDFEAFALAPDLVLLLYAFESDRTTLRSSLWRRREGEWKIVFHQGTIVSSSD